MTSWVEQAYERPAVAIVAAEDDALAAGVGSALRAAGVPALWISPDGIGRTPIAIRGRRAYLAGRPVSGLLFRAERRRPAWDGAASAGIRDAEARALWLAALSLDGVLALNRCDAWAWFDQDGDSPWRRVLLAARVPLSPLAFRSLAATAAPADGDEGEPSLVVCGRVVSGKERPAVLEAAAALTAAGLEIAELSTDARGRVVGVWSQPDFRDGQAVERSAALLAHRYHDHLQRRCS